MARAYSLDLRERVWAAWQRGEGTRPQLAARFGVSVSFVRDLARRGRERGEVTAKAHGGGRRPAADAAAQAAIAAAVAACNDATVDEHRQSLAAAGHRFARSTLGRWLRRLQLTRKKRRSVTTSAPPGGSRACAEPSRRKSPRSRLRTSSSLTRAGSTGR